MAAPKGQVFKSLYRRAFNGGINYFFGPRQVKDNESPDSVNCDFKGMTGVGNRQGITQIGTPSSYSKGVWGMNEFHTTAIDQAIKFVSNGSQVVMSHSTGSTWSDETGTTFTDAVNMDSIQAGGKLYTFNGTDAMKEWNGSTWGTTTNGKALLYGEYFDNSLWGVDPANPDTLWASGTIKDSKLGDFVYNSTSNKNAQSNTFQQGAGVKILGIKKFKGYLYVWLYPFGIYRVYPLGLASPNVYGIELVTNAHGCVAHRTICQVAEDVFFADSDGVYSLGDVANYAGVTRSTQKSQAIQRIFDALSGVNKSKLTAGYFNFKYHLFYSLYGTVNDSCICFDIRYQAWQDWRGMGANDCTTVTFNKTQYFYFGDSSNSKVYQMYLSSTDDGTPINSYWNSKSFDEGVPDLEKFYFDSSFILGALNGTAVLAVVFNDSTVAASRTLSQNRPQGGFGRDAFGRKVFGSATNTQTVTQYINTPIRLRAKGAKFAVGYRIMSSGDWRLDTIAQYTSEFSHFKFPSVNKLN
jgi:hypothetical protein